MKKLFFILLLLMLTSTAFADDFMARKQVKVGESVADFTLQNMADKPVKLSDLKGKVVMLHFWSAKCPFVVRYEDRLRAITADYKDKGVVIYAIDSNVTETKGQILKEAANRKLNYAILLDPDQKVADQFGAITTPHVFILDKEGKLVYEGAVDDEGWKEGGPINNQYVRKALDAVLVGQPVNPSETKTVGCTVKRK